MAALGSLVVSLTAQTAQFTQAMDRAAYQSQKNFAAMTSAAKAAGAAIGVALSGAAFVQAIKTQIDLADEIFKTSQKIGVEVEALQKLRYAADLSGVGSEQLTKALGKLSSEAVKGNDVFEQLGVAVRDSNGNLRSADDIFVDLADSVSKYSDGVGKTAAVSALFGERIARDLIPLLNLGAKGINDLKKEAEDLGFVMSSETAAAAERFNDNLTRLGRAKDSLFAKLAQQLLPAMEDLTNSMISLVKEGTIVQLLAKGLLTVFQTVAVVGSDLGFVIYQLGKGLQALGEATKSVAKGDFAAAKQAFVEYNKQAEESRAKLDAFQTTIMNLGKETKTTTTALKAKGDTLEGEAVSAEKVKTALDKLRQEYVSLFLTKQEMAILDLKMMGASAQQIADATALANAIKTENEARENAKKNLDDYMSLLGEYRSLYGDAASPAQKLADEEARLLNLRERLIKAGYDEKAVNDMIAEARMNAADKYDLTKDKTKEANKAALEFGDAFKSAFEDAITSGKSLQDVLRSLAVDIAKVVLRQTVTKPLGDWVTAAVQGYFGGGKALGGQVTGGTSYLVGEKGPELFTAPAGGGTITSNKDMTAMTTTAKPPEVNIKNINVLNPAIVGDYLNTADGERVILNVIQRNRGAFA